MAEDSRDDDARTRCTYTVYTYSVRERKRIYARRGAVVIRTIESISFLFHAENVKVGS